jgi:hypothetical protein
MRTNLTYTLCEWLALTALLTRPDAPGLTEPDLPSRINNAVGRSWLAGLRAAAIDVETADADVLRDLRSTLPDAEALAAIAEAERIVRAHQRRHSPR